MISSVAQYYVSLYQGAAKIETDVCSHKTCVMWNVINLISVNFILSSNNLYIYV